MVTLSLRAIKIYDAMTNRYAGEIHINPVRILRNDDFNNDGQIKDIQKTLAQAIELTAMISKRLQEIKLWLEKENRFSSIQFQFSETGHISVKGLTDDQLKMLEAKGLIELFDFATNKEWVKKYGQRFGLIWENGRAIEI